MIYYILSLACFFVFGNYNEPQLKNAGDIVSCTAPGIGNLQADTATTRFLVQAADGGLAEIEAGKLAGTKATDDGVKRFASMMVHDHTNANTEVKNLASRLNVSLPTEPSAGHRQKMDAINQKNGREFDKSYMDMMVEDHQKTISLFEDASKSSSDAEVKSFITTTIPKLKMHLDSAMAVRNALGK